MALKEAACAAIMGDAISTPSPGGRRTCAGRSRSKYGRRYGIAVDPEREITVTCGATEAMVATLLATTNPGDEVIVLAPYYENYWPDSVLAGATPRFVTLREPPLTRDPAAAAGEPWRLDLDELAAAFNERTAAIVINSPNNPTGKVLLPGGAGGDRRPLPALGRPGGDGRDLRAHRLPRASTSPWPPCPGWRSAR